MPDSYPSCSPDQGNFIDFPLLYESFFSLRLHVFSEVWRFSLFCTRFSCELQTVFLFPAGPWKAQGRILFIDSEYTAGMSAHSLCGLSVIFIAVSVCVCVCVCACVHACLHVDTLQYCKAEDKSRFNCMKYSVKFSETSQFFRPLPLTLYPIKWKKQFRGYIIECNFQPAHVFDLLSTLFCHSRSDNTNEKGDLLLYWTISWALSRNSV